MASPLSFDWSMPSERELSNIFTELWELDENRLQLGKDYQLNLQGGIILYIE